MANVVHKLSESEIQHLLQQITFETSQLPPGMKARTKYKQSVINIYNSGKVMFQGKMRKLLPNNYFQIIPLLPSIHHLLTNLQVKH